MNILSSPEIIGDSDGFKKELSDLKNDLKNNESLKESPYTIEESFGNITVYFGGDVSLTLSD